MIDRKTISVVDDKLASSLGVSGQTIVRYVDGRVIADLMAEIINW